MRTIFASHSEQMAAFEAEICTCSFPRIAHEQVDARTWGICSETNCRGFESAEDSGDYDFNAELAGNEAAYGVAR